MSAARSFAADKWAWSVECDGMAMGAANIPDTGLQGRDLGVGLGTMRFGRTVDPEDPGRTVLLFRANVGDALTAGAPRCEATLSPNQGGRLPMGQDFWFAFGLRLPGWVPGNDEQLLMQWHWSDGSVPLQPFLGLYLKANRLEIVARHDLNSPPSMATTRTLSLWKDPADVRPDRWMYFTMRARIAHDNRLGPYLQVWRDGHTIVDHVGPLGYNYSEVRPYAKIGHYQWPAAYNHWNPQAPTKTVLFRALVLVRDPAGKYTEADVRQQVMTD